jgi:hypothetical protein
MTVYTSLGDWLAEFERLHRLTFRSVALSATGFTTESPAFGRPRSMRPRNRWHGWRPVPSVGWISSRSFRPTGVLASYEMASVPVPSPRTIPLSARNWYCRAIGIVTGSPSFGAPTLAVRHGAVVIKFGDFRPSRPWQPPSL